MLFSSPKARIDRAVFKNEAIVASTDYASFDITSSCEES